MEANKKCSHCIPGRWTAGSKCRQSKPGESGLGGYKKVACWSRTFWAQDCEKETALRLGSQSELKIVKGDRIMAGPEIKTKWWRENSHQRLSKVNVSYMLMWSEILSNVRESHQEGSLNVSWDNSFPLYVLFGLSAWDLLATISLFNLRFFVRTMSIKWADISKHV